MNTVRKSLSAKQLTANVHVTACHANVMLIPAAKSNAVQCTEINFQDLGFR